MTLDEASAKVDVWPDNLPALNVFIAMSTQWRRAGSAGQAVGLDYTALPEVWRRTKTPSDQRDLVFDDLRVMEDAALEQMQRVTDQASKKRG